MRSGTTRARALLLLGALALAGVVGLATAPAWHGHPAWLFAYSPPHWVADVLPRWLWQNTWNCCDQAEARAVASLCVRGTVPGSPELLLLQSGPYWFTTHKERVVPSLDQQGYVFMPGSEPWSQDRDFPAVSRCSFTACREGIV